MVKYITSNNETLKVIFDRIYLGTITLVFIGSIGLLVSILRVL